jgi:glycosyltransferase involved in cell wall biosynthesis
MPEMKGRVAMVISYLPFGGAEQLLLLLAPRLRDLGWGVSVVCIRKAGDMAPLFEREGIRVEVIPFSSRWSPRSLYRLARHFKKQRIDIVHTHMYRSNTSGTAAARLGRVKVVISHIHNMNHWDDFRQLLVDRMLARYRDVIIAVSQGVRRNYLERARVSADKVIVLYNGVDLEPFSKGQFDAELATDLGIQQGEKVVSIIARLHEQKRHVDFLAMAAEVLKQVPKARFLIVGKGRLREQLEQRAIDLGIAQRCIFTGYRNDIAQMLALSDVAVSCSDKEGFSLSLIETLGAGVPIVATDVGGNAEAIVDGQSGFIVPPRRPDLLAQRVAELLTNHQLHESISKCAVQRASIFSIENMCKAIDRLYTKLLSGHRIIQSSA